MGGRRRKRRNRNKEGRETNDKDCMGSQFQQN
jgi:hypothetical protein